MNLQKLKNTHLFFDYFLPKSLNCSFVKLTGTMNNSEFCFWEVQWLSIVLIIQVLKMKK